MRYDVPDRITGREAYEELQHVCPNRDWRFVEVNIGFEVGEVWFIPFILGR